MVYGERLSDTVLGGQTPDLVLDADAVAAYGAGSIAELFEALGPQVQSSRGSGQPIVLVNGLRISGFREIRGYPPEAILRLEILPEDAALAYGFRADQRVVNLILKPDYRALTVEASGRFPTAGDGQTGEGEANLLRIGEDSRFSLDASYQFLAAILDADRSIPGGPLDTLFSPQGTILGVGPGMEIDPALSALAGRTVRLAGVPAAAADGPIPLEALLATAGQPDLVAAPAFRTLQGRAHSAGLGAAYVRSVMPGIAATLSGRLDYRRTRDLQGLAELAVTLPAENPFSPFGQDVTLLRTPALTPLERVVERLDSEVGLLITGDRAGWRWSVAADYRRADVDTLVDRNLGSTALTAAMATNSPDLNPFGPIDLAAVTTRVEASATQESGVFTATASRPIFDLPAGRVRLSSRLDGRLIRQSNRSAESTDPGETDLSRTVVAGQASLRVPLLDDEMGTGDLDLEGFVEAETVSDFALLVSRGANLSWRPFPRLRLRAAYEAREEAPSLAQLGDPVVITPNVRLFDFLTGQTVFVDRVEGGNPDLNRQRQRRINANIQVRPFGDRNVLLFADFLDSRTLDAAGRLPAATPAVRLAFPERFVTDEDGILVKVDDRPVNFAETVQRRLRSGLSVYRDLGGRAREDRRQRRAAQDQPSEAERLAQRLERDRQRTERGRLFGSFVHILQLDDQLLIEQGIPVLDFLDGAASGRMGGTPRHSVEGFVGYTRAGSGFRLSADWTGGSRLTGASPAEDLRFSPILRLNLRLFYTFTRWSSWVRAAPWLDRTRLILEVANLLDDRVQVTDGAGETPADFLPDRIDPVGRTIALSLRTQF